MMPRLLLLALFALAGIPLVLAVAYPSVGFIGTFLSVLVLTLALVDLLISPSIRRVEIQREAAEVMSVGAQNAVRVWLNHPYSGALSITVHDQPPEPSAWSNLPCTLEVPGGVRRYFIYHVEPHQRGRKQFGDLSLRMPSRLGLWMFAESRPAQQPVQVFPDIQRVHGVELLARLNRLAAAGVRMSRIRGRGNEFDRLREYRREDEFRSIDWKATARHQTLISREYVVERNQNLLLLLDCGRSMCNELDGISHFDRALNAAILLAYVALRQGDTVGLLAFSNQVHRWIPPLRGTQAVQTLVRQTYDLHPDYSASDYGLMAEELRRRYRKRSLVVLITHALDEVHLESLAGPIRRLKSPHLVVSAFLRNVPLMERMNELPETDLDAFQIAAAAEMAGTQALQLTQLEKSGILVADCVPDDLSSRLISQYLEIKARHLL